MSGPDLLFAYRDKVRRAEQILVAYNGKVRRASQVLQAYRGKVRLAYEYAAPPPDYGDLTWTTAPFTDSAPGAGSFCPFIEVRPETDASNPNQIGIPLIDSTNWIEYLPFGVDSSDYEVRLRNFDDGQGNTMSGPVGWVNCDTSPSWNIDPNCTDLDSGLVIITVQIAFRRVGGDPDGIEKTITWSYS